MTRALSIAMLLLVLAVPAWGQDVTIRTSRQPTGSVVLGQPVRLFVDVLFSGEMPHPPRVTAPRVDGAQVFRFETQATTIEDRIDGAPVTGQRFEFDLYPRRAGVLAVPPVQVTLLDAKGDVVGTRTGSAGSVRAIVPPGMDPSGPIVASSAVTLQEQWQPAPTGAFHVGDALVRTVTRSAADVPGLALVPLQFPAPDGVSVYVDAPIIRDAVERGAVTGRRIDRVTYVFEQAGNFVLPGLTQPWWDLASNAAHTLSRPAQDVHVAGLPAASPGVAWKWLFALAAVLLALLLCAVEWRLHMLTRFWRRCAGDASGERSAFRALRRTCRVGDAAPIYRAWQNWNMLRIGRPMTPELAASVTRLERCLFAQGGTWDAADARRLERAVQAARPRPAAPGRQSMLPPLNPIS